MGWDVVALGPMKWQREGQVKENLPHSPRSESIYGPGLGEKKKNDTIKGEAVLLRVLAAVWRGGVERITFCPNSEDPFSSSLLVLSWSKLSFCHWKSDPMWSFSVPYLTERPFLVLWQVNILPVLSVWESIPDGHSPYGFTSDRHS